MIKQLPTLLAVIMPIFIRSMTANNYTCRKIETHLHQQLSVNKHKKDLCSRGASIGAFTSIIGVSLLTHGVKKFDVNPANGYAFFKCGKTIWQAGLCLGISSLAGCFYYEKNNINLCNSLTDLYRAKLFLRNIKTSE